MKGFVIYPTYKVIDNKAYVCLFGRLENGESFLTVNEFKPYFYIKKDDLKLAKDFGVFEHEETDLRNFNEEKVVKIILDVPAELPKLRDKLREVSIECYEADIRFPYRFMMDNNIKGSLDVDGDYISSDRIDRIYKNPELKATDYKPENLKILSFDIESSKESDQLYCIGLVCGDVRKVFVNSKDKVEGAISCKDEEDVIDNFMKELLNLDPDIITGWNVIDFDFNLLARKCKKLKIDFDIGREFGNCKIKIEEGFFKESKVDIPGRQVLDGLNLLKSSFIKVHDYKLDTVAQTILGDGKLIHSTGVEKYKEIDDLFLNNKKKLCAYNLKDADLVLRIFDKTKIMELTVLRSLLTGMPLDRVNSSIASFDSLYIRKTIERKLVVPTGSYSSKENRIKGGYVRESDPGIYDYILILDFKSFYPSIMRTFNIDPYSYVSDCKGKNLIKAPNGACFRNENGILPEILTELYHERQKAIKNKDELTKHAIKILSNSFFGLLANPSCRFFDINMTNAITYFEQELIKLTSKEIQKLGYKVIYQDTDSNFLISNAKTLEEANKIGKKIEKHINEFYNNFIKKEYHRESFLELSYEKCFVKCLMPRLRGSEAGAKKRYAGLVIKDGKEEIQITGLEAVRGDWTELAKVYQNELLDRIFHDKDVIVYTKKFVDDVKKGKYDKLLVYRKSIRKELEEYTKSTPPHVKAARQLTTLDNTKIEYLMTEEGPEPIQNLKHKIDYKHYIEKQIKPIADAILIFFNTDFEDLMNGSKQSGLGDF